MHTKYLEVKYTCENAVYNKHYLEKMATPESLKHVVLQNQIEKYSTY